MPADADDGYARESPYIVTFQADHGPAYLQLAAALAGLAWTPPRDSLRLIDLGCGRGAAALALAAANPGWQVTGVDYMREHVAEAEALVAEAGLGNARFLPLDLSALDATALASLPEADVVIVHGLWSWVSDAVRAGVLQVLRHRLKPGGLAMVSYNAALGWAGDLAMAPLIRSLAAGLPGGPEARVAQAVEQALALQAAGAPGLAHSTKLRRYAGEGGAARIARDAAYLAHEFLNVNWRPCLPHEVAAAMAGAGLGFLGQARLWARMPALNLTPAQQAALAAPPAGLAPKALWDGFETAALRRDIFLRPGPGAAPAESPEAALAGLRLALCARPARPEIGIRSAHGAMKLPEAVVPPLLAALEAGPRRLSELSSLAGGVVGMAELAILLVASGVCAPAWREAVAPADRARALRFSQAALRRWGGELSAAGHRFGLAVPLLGGAIPLTPTEARLALRLAARPGSPAQLAAALLPPDAPAARRAAAEGFVRETLADRGAAWRAMGLVG
ncbi:class I SAM-dependent methyltransferase [Siccirubricoccus soli]|uniref:class I SAM-dependent methyltransferase n=1 Tax=Siccirubricoccus soli TaxID=2899147 RepID=UPI00273A702D|nr:class I SAM-dependent methyltransferase [Siccirubricoccus soli]